MKLRTVFACLLLLASTGLLAQDAERSRVKKMKVTTFNQLNIDAEINVVLVEDAEPGTIYLVGDGKHFADISLDVKGNELRVSSKKEINYRSKITVEIHVTDLEKMTVQKEALVSSGNILRSKRIDVILKGGSKTSLRSTGDINIRSEEDTELVFIQKTAGVTVVNR